MTNFPKTLLSALHWEITYKIRVAIKSKGKSVGARVITYFVNENKEVYLLTIYDKSEFDIIDDNIIKAIISQINANK